MTMSPLQRPLTQLPLNRMLMPSVQQFGLHPAEIAENTRPPVSIFSAVSATPPPLKAPLR
jgi:hypothetical protein